MRRKNLIYVYLSGFLLLLVLFHLYVFTKSVALKYEVANLKIKLRELKSLNRLLASKLSAEESLPLIEKKAISELNMYYPEKVNYIVVTEEVK